MFNQLQQWLDANPEILFTAFGILVVLAIFPKRRGVGKGKAKAKDKLDTVLHQWTAADVLTVRQLVQGGIHAFGGTGVGKTSSMNQIAAAIMRLRGSMLILCAKPGDREHWLKMAAKCGRTADVVLFSPDGPHRFNIFGHEYHRIGPGAGQVLNVVRSMMKLRNAVLRDDVQMSGDAAMWQKQDERYLTHNVTLLKFAGEDVTPFNIHRLAISAPRTEAAFSDKHIKQTYFAECLRKGMQCQKSAADQHDFDGALDFFGKEFVKMADRTQSSITTGVFGTLSLFSSGLARDMLSSSSTITPKVAIEQNKIVVVDWNPDEWGDIGRLANGGWKLMWQKDVLRRTVDASTTVSTIWGDESSLWCTSDDAEFLSRCRSHLGSMVYICQSLHNYRGELPGEKADSHLRAMLSNFSNRLFFALGDFETAEYAAELVGKELRAFVGGGVEAQPFEFKWGRDPYKTSSSFNQSYEYVLQPSEFMNGHRTGSAANDFQVDAFLVRSTPLSNGLPVIQVTFDQRR
ncbi:MAG TPA: TraM recognition domain-containing protein [Pirellulales bacterium]|nr:TraM recognition domain-containing protein [Pirellulales bacterium]